ncbi:sulfatase family protein [Pontiella sulfatireligans]|uniref:Arylsulfatase n=1 Tax=Pontiella sulfatireligans TaxID=2750658 RepID=A0A6C2UI69_9BACT|nr:sulfatase [Pontiella sulfatireligans]SPS74360.1 sulfatase S1_11 [Kiritimatiellales bacterium]VGO19563.1 Arylsulfatase [Pontiella sulfatireligans]
MKNAILKPTIHRAGSATIALLSLAFAATAHAKKPNIVFVFSDDHATQAISAYGGRLAAVAPTPNLDRIAENGMRFNRCMVGNSICGPSRATVLTGKHSHMNGFMRNETDTFDGSQQTFPKLLRKAGYQTAVIGKWHLESDPTGFDHWEILPGQGVYYKPEFQTATGTHEEQGYVTDVITDKAIQWLDQTRDPDKPFILMVQHKAPHREWSPALKYLTEFDDVEIPEPDTLFDTLEGRGTAAKEQDQSLDIAMQLGKDLKIWERDVFNELNKRIKRRLTPEQLAKWDAAYGSKNKKFMEANLKGKDLIRWKYQRYLKDYLRCIKSVDDSVGQIQQHLEKSGLLENTVFIYSSDQGFYLGEHGWFDKRFMYDESFRTPLLISWPGVTRPGSVNSDLVSNLDFAETFLEIAGVNIPSDMQGLSLVPILKSRTPKDWRNSVYYHYYEYPGWHMVHRHEGAYDGRYKLLNFYDLGEWELYDLKTDPNEMTNVYQRPEYAEVAKQMHRELEKLREQYNVPENIPQDLTKTTRRYYTEDMTKKAQAIRDADGAVPLDDKK